MGDGSNCHGASRGPGSAGHDVLELSRVEDRVSFAYFERCFINRSDNAIVAESAAGAVYVPAASLSVLMLGPGSTVSHRAMEMIGANGVTVVWVGEQGVRMYASGRPLGHSSSLLQRQAALVSNGKSRLEVARKMYMMRFEGEDVSKLTMQQLRGREGARVRRVYKRIAAETGVPWNGRAYVPGDYYASSEIDQALTAAHACLYGLVHAVIVSLGCSPSLGFVHTGHDQSFVYDIADLYKVELSIPVAFRVASSGAGDISGDVRRAMRDEFYRAGLMKRVVRDVKYLLSEGAESNPECDVVLLWDEKGASVSSGVQYEDVRDDSP